MNRLLTAAKILALLSLACLFISAAVLLSHVREMRDVTSAELQAVAHSEAYLTRQALQATTATALKQLGAESQSWRTVTDQRLAKIQADLAGTLQTAAAKTDARLGQLTATTAGLRADLKPTLRQATALMKDAQDTADDLYPDIKAAAATTTVAARSMAETAAVIEKAAPAFTASAQKNADNVAGITADVHVVTTHFTEPVSLPKRLWNVCKDLLAVGARVVR